MADTPPRSHATPAPAVEAPRDRPEAARPSSPAAGPPLLIPLADVPSALTISRAHLARLRASAKFGPAVLRLGRRLLVRRDELTRWVDAGLPDATSWRAMEAAGRRRRAARGVRGEGQQDDGGK
jgi:hypothetical protein